MQTLGRGGDVQPFDLNACDDALSEGFFGTVYSRSMAKNMRKLFAPHAHLFAGLPGYDRNLVENARTVRDFDEAVTRVTFGFPSVDAYYDASSSRRLIGDVRVPLLVIQAEDDPIAVREAVPREIIANAKQGNVLLVGDERGRAPGMERGEGGAVWRAVAGYRRHAIFRGGARGRRRRRPRRRRRRGREGRGDGNDRRVGGGAGVAVKGRTMRRRVVATTSTR